jgi:signal transduction histidine kinase
MVSIRGLISRLLYRSFISAVVFVVLFQATISLLLIVGVSKFAEKFLVSYTTALIEKNETIGYQVLLDNELNAFVDTLNMVSPVDIRVRISKGERVLFEPRSESMERVWLIERTYEVGSTGGSYIIDVSLNPVRLIIYNLLAFASVVLAAWIFLRRQSKSLDIGLKPLDEEAQNLVKEIGRVSAILQTTDVSFNLNPKITELAKVSESLEKFISTIRDQKVRIEELTYSEALIDVSRKVAHDIRSPLSALNMVIATLGILPDEKRNLIKNALGRINQISDDLLRQSKIVIEGRDRQARKILISPSKVIAAVCEEKLIEFSMRPELSITAQYEGDHEVFVEFEKGALERILSNLLNNSAEAITGRGSIILKMQSTHAEVIISIEDSGVGVPHEVLSQLGKKGFSYGKKATGSGSGLGLYTAIEMIEAHEGSLTANSEFGLGTTVKIHLKRAQKDF